MRAEEDRRPWDVPDFDYKKEFKGYQCFVDFDACEFHDYTDLAGHGTISKFLLDHENAGFDQSNWDKPNELIDGYKVKPLQTLCQNCEHSKEKNSSADPMRTYHMPAPGKLIHLAH